MNYSDACGQGASLNRQQGGFCAAFGSAAGGQREEECLLQWFTISPWKQACSGWELSLRKGMVFTDKTRLGTGCYRNLSAPTRASVLGFLMRWAADVKHHKET